MISMINTHINKDLKKTGKSKNVIIKRWTYTFLKMFLDNLSKLSDLKNGSQSVTSLDS